MSEPRGLTRTERHGDGVIRSEGDGDMFDPDGFVTAETIAAARVNFEQAIRASTIATFADIGIPGSDPAMVVKAALEAYDRRATVEFVRRMIAERTQRGEQFINEILELEPEQVLRLLDIDKQKEIRVSRIDKVHAAQSDPELLLMPEYLGILQPQHLARIVGEYRQGRGAITGSAARLEASEASTGLIVVNEDDPVREVRRKAAKLLISRCDTLGQYFISNNRDQSNHIATHNPLPRHADALLRADDPLLPGYLYSSLEKSKFEPAQLATTYRNRFGASSMDYQQRRTFLTERLAYFKAMQETCIKDSDPYRECISAISTFNVLLDRLPYA